MKKKENPTILVSIVLNCRSLFPSEIRVARPSLLSPVDNWIGLGAANDPIVFIPYRLEEPDCVYPSHMEPARGSRVELKMRRARVESRAKRACGIRFDIQDSDQNTRARES